MAPQRAVAAVRLTHRRASAIVLAVIGDRSATFTLTRATSSRRHGQRFRHVSMHATPTNSPRRPSIDGKRVANYAQWKSKEDFERMLQNPEAQKHMQETMAIAKATPVLYQVTSVHH
jgi:hypothetical protein